MLKFKTKTGEIEIDTEKCEECNTYACVKACSLYGRDILKIEGGAPALRYNREETKRRDNECLSCEEACRLDGCNAITIKMPVKGLEEVKKKEKEEEI